MKRDKYIAKLLEWKNEKRRKPLILEGARQVGKTWLMQEFAKAHFGNVVYLRFDRDATLRRIFTEFKGALTEQYVLQELVATAGYDAHYWSTDDSRTEVDFLLQRGMEVVPLEVKAERNVKSQSLKSYLKRYRPAMAIRASMLPYAKQEIPLGGGGTCQFCNVPLPAVALTLT